MIKGVCARIADSAGVPVWMPRTAFIIFGLLHWFFAVVAYIVIYKLICPARNWAVRNSVPPAGFTAPQNDVRNRFAALDRRLAEMEAATLQQEASLRRAFRDLERG
jgi:phage shock protein PspC (stress-responsive transcriptional regulator)